MDKFGNNTNAIIAGASGLVGSQLLQALLSDSDVCQVTALVRHPLEPEHPKLTELQNPDLKVADWYSHNPVPETGYICLGTTLKQAGSREALAYVDLELVTEVARTMKQLGVKRLAVVSSYGANPRSFSHYLRCKGKMEQNLLGMGFDRVVFMRPGPLAGERSKPRTDEVVAKWILLFLGPLLIGKLANFRPVQASAVAKAMILALNRPFTSPSEQHITLNTRQINKLVDNNQPNPR